MGRNYVSRVVSLILTCLATVMPALAQPGGPPRGPGGPGPDPLVQYLSMLDELNQKPQFNLTAEQKQKIQAARDDFKVKQDKWRADHAEQIKQIQELSAALFGTPGA